MATYYKRSTVTTLGSTSAWSTTGPTGVAAAAVPNSADTVIWNTGSLGGALTGNLTFGALQINNATSNITHSSGTITSGSSIDIPSNITFSTAGTLISGDSTWTLASSGTPLTITGALQSSSPGRYITITGGRFNYDSDSASSTYNGTIDLSTNATLYYNVLFTDIATQGTQGMPNAIVKVSSSSARIIVVFNSDYFPWFTPRLRIASDANLSNTGSMFTERLIDFEGGPWSLTVGQWVVYKGINFDSGSGNHSISTGNNPLFATYGGGGFTTVALGNRKITFNSTSLASGFSISVNITGTNGFIKDGPGYLEINYNASTSLSGDITINNGLLVVPSPPFLSSGTIDIASTSSTLGISSSTDLPTVTGVGNMFIQATRSISPGYFLNNPNASLGYGVGSKGGTVTLSITEFPVKLLYHFRASSSNAVINWDSSSSVDYSGEINIESPFTYLTTTRSSLINNQADPSHTITISGQINILRLQDHTFVLGGSNTGNNTIYSSIPDLSATSFTKEGAGKWILSGSNSFAGAVTLTAGTLTCTNSNALGSSSSSAAVTLTSGTLQLSGGTDINKFLSTFNYGGATVQNLDGFNSIEASSHVLNANTSFDTSSGTLYLWGPVAGASTYTLTKTGSGDLELNNSSSGYLGPTTISSGRLFISSIQNPGISSSLGAPASAQATITMGSNATLAFKGESSSTTRNISSSAASGSNCTLENSGTGALTYASGGTFVFSVAGTHTLELSGSCTTESNFGRTLANSTSAVSLLKSGAGAWLMSGNMTATGSITITGGDFRITGTTTTSHNVTCGGNSANFGSTNRTFASLLVSSGTVSITAGNTISAPTTMSGGTITAILTGANTLTITSGASNNFPATIQPNDTTNGNNAFTGSVSINGCVDLATSSTITPSTSGRGRVLGTSNTVTVSSTGVIRTKTGPATNQRGQVRYNNLTFQSGSTIKIGKAA